MTTLWTQHNTLNDERLPAGGFVEHRTGEVDEHGNVVNYGECTMLISWQNGPVKDNGVNGVQVEDVLQAALQRLQFLNTAAGGRFSCRENSLAITKIEEALMWLGARTARRVAEGTEGTHEGR